MACLSFDILCPALSGGETQKTRAQVRREAGEHGEGSPFFALPKLEITHPCPSGKESVFESLHYIGKAKEVSLNAKGNSIRRATSCATLLLTTRQTRDPDATSWPMKEPEGQSTITALKLY